MFLRSEVPAGASIPIVLNINQNRYRLLAETRWTLLFVGNSAYVLAGENVFHCILGGQNCYIVHPSDTAPMLAAFGAVLRISGPEGDRTMPVDQLHVPPSDDPTRETYLSPGEIITSIILPPVRDTTYSRYRKVRTRRAWDFALAALALVLNMDGPTVDSARVYLSGCAPVPWRSVEIEESITLNCFWTGEPMSTEKNSGRMLIRIGGEAGQGLETVGEMLAKSLVRSGYEVLTTQRAMSRIRGGHNYFSILTGTDALSGPEEEVDLLVAFTQETVDVHKGSLSARGLILIGPDMEDQGLSSVLNVPYSELAEDRIMANVAALGVVSAMIGLSRELVSGVVQDALGSKNQDLLSQNLQVLDNGIKWSGRQSIDFQPLPEGAGAQSKLALNGNEAIALGALAGGVNFCSFYPMTPATSVALNLISQADELGVICEQAEDEISVINMALGASFCGARSLVPTSGGGFALMGEGISLAGMTETPVVIVLAQRPGPATGLPTQTEQGDLELALASGHGEFPRAIMAPGNAEECFHLTIKALELAERYQTPVILLTDQYLATSIRAVQRFDLSSINIPPSPGTQSNDPESYKRFAWSESGISPRLIPGAGRHLVVVDSDEHTPDGHITEDHQIRVGMVDKRLKKLEGLIQETLPPGYEGDDDPELLLMTWGSSQGAVQEAAKIMHQQGDSVATLSFSQVWPLNPEHFEHYLSQAGRVVSVEGNATGQFAKLIRRETGFQVHEQVLRYDGLPLTAKQIIRQVQS